ncbi:hypothetical protein ASG89_22780 [Paenibacillus sp. Soil766]|uniref:S-layer homology domain-containing protein n=1 Tax=Paenibacillus sp. Soil766 TaxID=1736404 RepID=UPI0007090E7D|nr:S-layer homology domain-containing protein [Paenibacillus sp. Soil766]KRF03290.1 hypothetical protein ASG89_22780 [Paenibacillus sp. Soil766]
MKQAIPSEKGLRKVSIKVESVEQATSFVIDLPINEMKGQEDKLLVEISTPLGTVTLPGELIPISTSEQSRLTLLLEPAEPSNLNSKTKEAIGNRTMIKVSLLTDRLLPTQETLLPSIGISLPYTPTAEELKNAEHIVVWRIGTDGTPIAVVDGKYNHASGMVTFHDRNLNEAVYAITFVEKTFQDTAAYKWAEEATSVLASKGIIHGTSESTFAPGELISRADFLMLLIHSLGLTADMETNFSDVDKNAYFAKAVGIAFSLGITEGTGGDRFEPESFISRQDIFTLTARALNIADKLENTGSKSDLSIFADHAVVAEYARESVTLLTAAGILQGDGHGIRPLDEITRAEAAVMLYRVYNK